MGQRKIKILAISFLFPNRVMPEFGIFVLNRLKALQAYADVTVINPIPWSPIHEKIERYQKLKDIPVEDSMGGLRVYHPRFLSIPKYFKSVEAISYSVAVAPIAKKIYLVQGFDIVDLHWTYPDLPAGARIARKYGKPLSVTLRGKEAFYYQEADMRQRIVGHYLPLADKVIALSEELKTMYGQATGCLERADVIRNGVDKDKFYYMPQNRCREELGLNPDEKIIVSVGSLIIGKGFDLIINVLPEIVDRPEFANIRLYIIGEEGRAGYYRAELLRLVEQKSMQDHVIFQGLVDNGELIKWYNAADMFCLASRSEGSPNVLTEALACGCPSLATDVGSVREIIESEPEIGVCVPSEDEGALRSGLEMVLEKAYSRAENAAAFSKYDWDWCARRVYEAFSNLLDGEDIARKG